MIRCRAEAIFLLYWVITNSLLNELMHDKTNKITYAPSEDSSQPEKRLLCPHEKSLGPKLSIEHTVKTDQTGLIPRLIRVFTGGTCHFVGFVML